MHLVFKWELFLGECEFIAGDECGFHYIIIIVLYIPFPSPKICSDHDSGCADPDNDAVYGSEFL